MWITVWNNSSNWLTTSIRYMKKWYALSVDCCFKSLVQLNDHMKKLHEKSMFRSWKLVKVLILVPKSMNKISSERNQLPGPLENKLKKVQLDLGPHQKNSLKNSMPRMWINVWNNSSNWMTASTRYMKKCYALNVDCCLQNLVQLDDHMK